MRKTIAVDNIKVGMYVVLPVAWYKHPFAKSEFIIKSEDQIQKICDSGIVEVIVDIEKSIVNENKRTPNIPSHQPAKPVSRSVVPEELIDTIHNSKLTAQQKAKAIQKHSVSMISNLFNSPTADNIKQTKKGISEIVDLILSHEEMSKYLLSITSHDYCTYTHSVNVGFLGVSLSKVLFRRSTAHDMHELGAGFFLHDLGKVHIDAAIIKKPGILTETEMEQMRKHPGLGYTILRKADQLSHECKKIVMQHHERFDGRGYPYGLSGEEIHLYGRICSIADVFDALTSDRPYRQKLSTFGALKLMKEEMISHFHEELFEQFVLLFT